MQRPSFIATTAIFCLAITASLCRSQDAASDPALAQRIADATKRLNADPNNADLLVERAELYQFSGRWDEVRRDADRAIQLSPRNAKARGLKGLAMSVAQEFDRALAELDAAVALEPTNAVLWALRGNTLLQMGRCRDALESLDRSIALAPDARAYFDRAACHRENGDPAKAIEDYTAALRHDPQLVAAACERAFVYQQKGHFSQALEDLKRCQTGYPRDPQLQLSIAWILATCPDDKIRDGRRALRIAGELCDPVTCETSAPLNALAAAHAEMGDFAEAEKLLRRAVALSPFDRSLREASAQRLAAIRRREPIRDAATVLSMPPRIDVLVPANIRPEDAVSAPAEVLALDYLNTATLLVCCPIAQAGATINGTIDGLSLKIESQNAGQVEKRLKERRRISEDAIRKRGHEKLSAGYVAKTEGDCGAWGLSDGLVLIEQDGFNIFITQGVTRHMGVVVESTVAMRHDGNTGIRLSGVISDGVLVFTTAQRGGLDGTAKSRCKWTLEPRAVEGAEWADAFCGRAIAHRSYDNYREAVRDVDTAMRLRPNAETASLQAFMLATCEDETVRDGRRAVQLAERAKSLSGGKLTANVLMALAAAHAEAGDFREAVMYQTQVIGVVADDEKPMQRERLRLFEAGKPFRESREPLKLKDVVHE